MNTGKIIRIQGFFSRVRNEKVTPEAESWQVRLAPHLKTRKADTIARLKIGFTTLYINRSNPLLKLGGTPACDIQILDKQNLPILLTLEIIERKGEIFLKAAPGFFNVEVDVKDDAPIELQKDGILAAPAAYANLVYNSTLRISPQKSDKVIEIKLELDENINWGRNARRKELEESLAESRKLDEYRGVSHGPIYKK